MNIVINNVILTFLLIRYRPLKRKDILLFAFENNLSSLMHISYGFLSDIPLPDESIWKVENRERPSIVSTSIFKLFFINYQISESFEQSQASFC